MQKSVMADTVLERDGTIALLKEQLARCKVTSWMKYGKFTTAILIQNSLRAGRQGVRLVAMEAAPRAVTASDWSHQHSCDKVSDGCFV